VNYTDLTDETLIGLINRSQTDALSELYDRYHRLVFSLALNIVGEPAAAEEVTLDVFTRVWEKAESYRSDQSRVKTWLLSITRYRSIDVLRRSNARPEHNRATWAEVSSEQLARASNSEEMVEQALQQERVRAAVAQLPPDQKEALALAYFKGYTHSQIAETLNQPLGTIKSRIRLAMQKLRDTLQEEASSLHG
jgi:RNA polymerase sigma-70 factor (ECF subfamily)